MRRRTFLRLGTIGPAMLVLGRLPPAPASRASASTEEALLTPDDREVLLAVAERMVHTGEPGAPSPREVGAIERVERLLGFLDADLVAGLRLALWIVDLWPAVIEMRLRRFRSLTDAERDESLEGWRRSQIESRRRVFQALRAVSLYGYWSAEETWPLIGYPGPWIGRAS